MQFAPISAMVDNSNNNNNNNNSGPVVPTCDQTTSEAGELDNLGDRSRVALSMTTQAEVGKASPNLKKFFLFVTLCALLWVFQSSYLRLTYNIDSAIISSAFTFRNLSSVLQNTTIVKTPAQLLNLTEPLYRKYSEISERYRGMVSSATRHQYKPGQTFIEFGKAALFRNSSYKTPKLILLWTTYFRKQDWAPPSIQCSWEVTCTTSSNRSLLADSDAVIMHASDFRHLTDLPGDRLPHQRWVYLSQESPYHTKIPQFREFNGVFNWTATYRRDSDVLMPYFGFDRRDSNLTETSFHHLMKNITLSKATKHLVAYMNSNCRAVHTQRLSYIMALKQFISVDIYGRCGTLKCQRDSRECDSTMKRYKFYLAMENSHCRDYITEKVAQPLFMWNSVPVVMGGADPGDYEDVLPPGSYIHTSGFRSPKELAEYLHLLDNNPTLYEKYHRWRITHQQATGEGNWCKLCRKLHNESLPTQTYRDFIGWYNEDTCKIY